jgi:PAS domain S-box-containing protein
LLLRLERGVVTVLGGLRNAPTGSGTLRLPVAETVLASLEGGPNGEGFVEGVDYRRQLVLASVRRVPGTPWILLAKMDRAEVLGPFERGFRWTELLVATILFVSLLAGMGVYFRDRRRMLATLERANQRFLALFDLADEGVVLFDRGGRVLSANAKAREMFRVGEGPIEGQSITGFFKDAELEARPLRWGALEERVSLSAERHLMRSDGEPLIAQLQTVTLPDGRFLTIVHDHTERRAAQMRERRAKQMAKLGAWEWDIPRQRVHWDDETFRILGYDPACDLASNEAWQARIHPADRETVERLDGRGPELGDQYEREYRILLPDGNVRWVRAVGDMARDSFGVVVHIEGAIQDVTEQHEALTALEQARAQLAESQRAEAVGRLAGGIAHDFNNVVGIILGYCELVEMELAADHPARVHLREIGAAGRRAAELTKRLLAFSRRQPVERRVVDFAGVLADARGLLEPILGKSIELELSAPVDVGALLADPSEISQMMVNLASHARDAMPRGGRLALVARAIEIDEATAKARPPLVAGPGIELRVEDNGPGMDEATLRTCFEPFSATQGLGVESGLGLWVVKRVVENYGGTIDVESAPGRGTRFLIRLPAVREGAGERESAAEFDELGRSERVLVVDDVAQMRDLAKAILSRAGFEVTTTESPEQALAWIEDSHHAIDLLLTDIVMPRLDGRLLAKRALELRPELLVLFMTGYADLPPHDFPGSLPPECLIEKPFTGPTLARKVRTLLDRRTAIASAGN